MGRAHLTAVTTPDIEGLDQLERAVVDEDVSLATALRRFLLIAGYAHQEELRAWALKQLEGYEAGEEVPRFREVAATLEMTLEPSAPGRPGGEDTRQVSPYQLPQSVRDRGIGEHAPIRYGVREMEALIAMGWNLELRPPGSAEYLAERRTVCLSLCPSWPVSGCTPTGSATAPPAVERTSPRIQPPQPPTWRTYAVRALTVLADRRAAPAGDRPLAPQGCPWGMNRPLPVRTPQISGMEYLLRPRQYQDRPATSADAGDETNRKPRPRRYWCRSEENS
ncbi:hypothetical protein ACF09K_31390 [Streptomyces sp. NPDC014882]|uniref:AbiTii domain-containing protein n=1 Tax=Streptomyces sp. NPDC014882 TaxID=3364927 RepID=UPI0036FD7F89